MNQYRDEIRERETHGGEMVSHLMRLFDETCQMQPRLIVELGVRKGMSTFALERAARLSGATLVCVDQVDCAGVVKYGEFVLAEDVEFAGRFQAFCEERGVEPAIDVLLIDTSHTYEHTRAEIKAWIPLMAKSCKVMLHDTNPSPAGWNKAAENGRYGVASALGAWLGRTLPWQTAFEDTVKGWAINHNPHYMGLTILTRMVTDG